MSPLPPAFAFFDTETTGLDKPGGVPLDQQPYIVEIAVIVTDINLTPIRRYESFVKPGIPIPEEASKISGITDADVEAAPKFGAILNDLAQTFLGVPALVAHNAPFDVAMMRYALERCGGRERFPWPPEHICTAELSEELPGRKRRRLENLAIEFFPGKYKGGSQRHRAMADVEILVEVYTELRRRGIAR